MRKSFVLYTSYYEQVQMLGFYQRGILLTAIMAHACGDDDELPDLNMEPETEMLFSMIASQMDRDGEKFDRTCERRRAAAKKRWESSSMQMHANAGVNDNEDENENDNGDVFHKEIKRRRNKRPAEQHNYDFKQIEADLLRRQREGLGT